MTRFIYRLNPHIAHEGRNKCERIIDSDSDSLTVPAKCDDVEIWRFDNVPCFRVCCWHQLTATKDKPFAHVHCKACGAYHTLEIEGAVLPTMLNRDLGDEHVDVASSKPMENLESNEPPRPPRQQYSIRALIWKKVEELDVRDLVIGARSTEEAAGNAWKHLERVGTVNEAMVADWDNQRVTIEVAPYVPPVVETPEELEREEFEKWFQTNTAASCLNVDAEGVYIDNLARLYWEGWKAKAGL